MSLFITTETNVVNIIGPKLRFEI